MNEESLKWLSEQFVININKSEFLLAGNCTICDTPFQALQAKLDNLDIICVRKCPRCGEKEETVMRMVYHDWFENTQIND